MSRDVAPPHVWVCAESRSVRFFDFSAVLEIGLKRRQFPVEILKNRELQLTRSERVFRTPNAGPGPIGISS
jgi:hypothetical protein